MTFLALWSARAFATILLGALLTYALRRRSAATRNLALRVTLIACWILPLAVLVAPPIRIALPAPPPANIETTPVDVAQIPSRIQPTTFSEPAPTPVPLPQQNPIPVVPIVYGLGVASLIARWILGLARLRKQAQRGIPAGPKIARVAMLGVPATFGLFRPTILLPLESADWSETRIAAAVLHERAHIRRQDWAWQTLAGLFAALHWFNPAAWLLARALRDSAEVATDDEVLATGIAPSRYARELLAVASLARPIGPALRMARRGGISDRIAMILSTHRDRRRPTRRLSLALGAGLLLATLCLAGIGKPVVEDTFVKLKSGQEIRVALIVDPIKKLAWTADGKPAEYPIAPRPVALPRTGKQPRIVAIDCVGETSEGPYVGFHTPYIAGEELWQSRTTFQDADGHTVTRRWFPLSVPPAVQIVDGKLNLSVASWRDERTFERGKAPGQASIVSASPIRLNEFLYIVSAHTKLTKSDRQYRLLPIDREGKPFQILGSEGMRQSNGDAGFMVHVRVEDQSIHHWQLRSRPTETIDLKGIHLQPEAISSVPVESGATTDSQYDVELLGFAEGNRTWKPDGTLDIDLPKPPIQKPLDPKWRCVAAILRVRGDLSEETDLRATVWGKYAYPSKSVVLQRVAGHPDERLAWCYIDLRSDVNQAKLGLDLVVGPWRKDLELSSDQVDVQKGPIVKSGDGKSLRQFNVRLQADPVLEGNRTAWILVAGQNKTWQTISMPNPQLLTRSFPVFMPISDSPRQITIQSKAVEHRRFENVSLRPR